MLSNILLPEIRLAMGYSENEFANLLGISQTQLEKTLEVKQLRLDQLTLLAQELNCSVETFAQGFFDLEVVKSRYSTSNSITLPKRYLAAAFSKVRTSLSLFQFIELYFGKQYSDRVMKVLQL